MILIWSDAILAEACATQRRIEVELRWADVPGELVISGPASLPGVLTTGDIDLHLRVPPERYEPVVGIVQTLYRPTSLPSWAPTLAVFDIPAERPTGLAVTPVGSPHDRRFTVAWQRLRAEPALVQEYNALKSEAGGTTAYEERKSAFFTRITGD